MLEILFNQGRKDLAGAADVDFVFVRGIAGAFTQGTAEEPAEVATLEFPGRTIFAFLTFFLVPAWSQLIVAFTLVDEQKEKLPFNMSGNRTPPLLITVNRFQRHAKQGRKLFLGLAELFPDFTEFCFLHDSCLSSIVISNVKMVSLISVYARY